MPAHVRAEPGIAAAVPDDPTEPKVVRHEQAVSVAAADQAGGASAEVQRQLRLDRALDLLHLAAGGTSERVVIVRPVAWRESVDEAGDPAGEVRDRREHPAHRGQRAVAVDRLLQPRVVAPDVASSEAIDRDLLLQVGRWRSSQRREQSVPDEILVFGAGAPGDHPAEDPVAQVGVLEPACRAATRWATARAGGREPRRTAVPAGGRPTDRRSAARRTWSGGCRS